MLNRLFGLDNSDLIELYPNHWVHQDAAEPIRQLQADAQAAGFDLRLASSYRSFERQLNIWNDKYNGIRPSYTEDGKLLDIQQLTPIERVEAICIYSAIPGFSRHHWGSDIDIYDAKQISRDALQLVESEYQQGGPCYELSSWLHASTLAEMFTFPYNASNTLAVANEPWHISYSPVSKSFENELTPNKWLEVANAMAHEIAGFNTLVTHLDTLFKRYVRA